MRTPHSMSETHAPARFSIPAWLPVLAALGCAFGFRWVGDYWAAEQETWTARLVFTGVAVAAALVAGIAGRIWTTPAATIVLGVLAGLLATHFEDNVLGAVAGFSVGALIATAFVWKTLRRAAWGLLGSSTQLILGVATGGVVGACVHQGGFGWVQGGGVLFAAWLVRQALRDEQATRRQLWLSRVVFSTALVGGFAWLAPTVQPWLAA